MKILTISGSLRESSTNSRLLDALPKLAPGGMRLERYLGMGRLPHFNPDLDPEGGALLPPEVVELRREVREASGLIISSPEYAHGVPGSLKNLLDWLVSSTDFPGKPVVLMNVSAGDSEHVQAQLSEILRTMSASLLPSRPLRAAQVRVALGPDGFRGAPELESALRSALAALDSAARN